MIAALRVSAGIGYPQMRVCRGEPGNGLTSASAGLAGIAGISADACPIGRSSCRSRCVSLRNFCMSLYFFLTRLSRKTFRRYPQYPQNGRSDAVRVASNIPADIPATSPQNPAEPR